MRWKEQAKVEPRSCQRTKKTKERQTARKEETTNPKRKKTSQPNHERTKSGPASGKPLFDTVIEGSDAESKVGQRLTGAPPWETQRGCTDELIGSNLVEHEKLGRHPWWRCGSVSGNHWVGQLEEKLKRAKGLERCWLVLDKSAPRVLFQA